MEDNVLSLEENKSKYEVEIKQLKEENKKLSKLIKKTIGENNVLKESSLNANNQIALLNSSISSLEESKKEMNEGNSKLIQQNEETKTTGRAGKKTKRA